MTVHSLIRPEGHPESRRRFRVAMVCSHAIQYFMPWFRQLARHPRIDLTVLLGDGHGLDGESHDPEFGRKLRWDVPLVEGVPCVRLRNHAPRPGVGRFFGVVNLGLWALIGRERFDAVVIHGWNYALYPIALAAARAQGIPVLLRAESGILKGEPPRHGPMRRLVRDALLSAYLSQCAAGLAVSSANRRLLRALGLPEWRIFSCPYAVDAERFSLSEEERLRARRSWRERLGVTERTPLILSVGKLIPVKDHALLIDAYAGLRGEGAGAALCIAGDGALRDHLSRRAQGLDGVHLIGFQNQSELPALYAAADVFVLPSRRETFGLVVNEAMHAGLPVICSDGVGCAEDLLREGETGLGFRAGDADGLHACLRRLCAGEVAERTRRAMGERGRALISGWTFAEATSGLLRALDKVVPRGEEARC